MFTTSATRKLTRFQYAATILGALAVAALAPATAHATDNQPTGTGGGCHYTDADGYDVPIDDGQDVFVDGKIVSCRGGSIVVTTAPMHGAGSVRGQLDPNLSVLAETPRKSPLVNRPVSKAP
ncbi:hypothetical protein [Mycolicibacterium hodleri]|uniref:DUF5666 domain-containing protein n=1 Tax=Mycolicibacterium hodleri TaxID=49897 RepID=A0A502EBH6_9MYCO|nr:hypothetical protein [Mycolicibacterium hodleri]TPG34339.1 hypothetical protein EAH80_12235 [Mycolicibacterium hodleri]